MHPLLEELHHYHQNISATIDQMKGLLGKLGNDACDTAERQLAHLTNLRVSAPRRFSELSGSFRRTPRDNPCGPPLPRHHSVARGGFGRDWPWAESAAAARSASAAGKPGGCSPFRGFLFSF